MSQIQHYSRIQRLIHWLMAFAVVSLFALGVWMVDLTYYSEWYQLAPHWHQSIGVMLALVWGIRLVIRFIQGTPPPLAHHRVVEKFFARVVHALMYLFLFILFASGYLISTGDGRGIEVFNWFTIPSLGELFPRQADLAGLVHEYVAYILILLALFHALGALKHHFIDKDETLNRMLGR